jgi:hypothetical protein
LHPYVGSGSSFSCYVESLIDSGQVIWRSWWWLCLPRIISWKFE